jgi:hypothetical protein
MQNTLGINTDRIITAPTTRRVHCDGGIYPGTMFAETDAEGRRLFLTADRKGDNNLYVVAPSEEEYRSVCGEMSYLDVPWPEARFGSWQRYRQTLAWTKWVIDHLGWELTREERELLQAMEELAEQAPASARRRAAA